MRFPKSTHRSCLRSQFRITSRTRNNSQKLPQAGGFGQDQSIFSSACVVTRQLPVDKLQLHRERPAGVAKKGSVYGHSLLCQMFSSVSLDFAVAGSLFFSPTNGVNSAGRNVTSLDGPRRNRRALADRGEGGDLPVASRGNCV